MGSPRQTLYLNEYIKRLTFDETFFAGCINDTAKLTNAENVVVPHTAGVAGSLFIANNVATDTAGATVTGLEFATVDYIEYSAIKRGFPAFTVSEEDEQELSINSHSEVLDERILKLQEAVAETIGWGFASEIIGSFVRTSSTKTAVNKFGNTTKVLTLADFNAADLKLDEQKVPKQGRRMMVSPRGYAQLKQLIIDEKLDFQQTADAMFEGKVGRLLGYDIYMSHSLPSYTSALAKKPLQGAVDANTDLECMILYHPTKMRYVFGDMQIVEKPTPLNTFNNSTAVEGWVRCGSRPSSKPIAPDGGYIGSVTIVEGK